MISRILKAVGRRLTNTKNQLTCWGAMILFGNTKYTALHKWQIIRNEYKLLDFRPHHRDWVVAIMTPNTEFAGLADRIRSILSAYIIAKNNNRQFYLFHDKDFHMEQYLLPNEIDWRISPHDIHRGITKVQHIWFDYTKAPYPKKQKELHTFMLQSNLSSLLKTCPEGTSVSSLFHELFRPSPHLSKLIANVMEQHELQSNGYIAFHARFLNFFEPVEEYSTKHDVTGTPEQQATMISLVHRTILTEMHKTGIKKALLFSDSNSFLNIPHPEGIQVLPGKVGHILKEKKENVIDKAFVDLFMLSHAKKIYSLIGENIYGGGFAWTAALISNKPYEKLRLQHPPTE